MDVVANGRTGSTEACVCVSIVTNHIALGGVFLLSFA